jgi:hypothetical protein
MQSLVWSEVESGISSPLRLLVFISNGVQRNVESHIPLLIILSYPKIWCTFRVRIYNILLII